MKKRRIELIKADKSHRTCYQDRIDLIIVLFDTSDRTSYTHFDELGTVTMGRYQIPGPRLGHLMSNIYSGWTLYEIHIRFDDSEEDICDN